ncbi:enoyl-CoA hydratase-related protein [Pseudoalteromonas sp. Of7M-16]|uniref:enoyl-CoA hydratase-related protein n=1 Tax=Pseudoalteromonas sp. Of7M-16 TaxID=2917756 RepID=UPI001EF4410F|nr:enoyl-CoA hydratase-related protein [Pseudoalteromonas sp. Of7M-16]
MRQHYEQHIKTGNEFVQVRATSVYASEPLAIMRSGSLHWATMQLDKAPYFTKSLLQQLGHFYLPESRAQNHTIKVLSSDKSGVFSLGGDLVNLTNCVKQQNEPWLRDYAFNYMTLLHRILAGSRHNLTSIVLVQGRAYGAGMEVALCADCVVAEEGAEFFYPPVAFNHGLEHLLVSKLKHKASRCALMEVMYSNTRFSARDLYELGLVDVLTECGKGEQSVRGLVQRAQACDIGHTVLQKYRHRKETHSVGQFSSLAEAWVKKAVKVDENQQKYLRRLGRVRY